MIIKDKLIWITGASSGIGEALAYECSKAGAKLIISARRSEELERVKSNCVNSASINVIAFDMADTDTLPSVVNSAVERFGNIDAVVHCAGISQRSFTADTSINVYRKMLEVNFFSIVQQTLAVLPHFKKRNQGHFVVISSLAGISGLPLRSAYSASKFAIEGFISALRAELWKTDIKILIVRPGAIKTNIAKNALTGDGKKSLVDQML